MYDAQKAKLRNRLIHKRSVKTKAICGLGQNRFQRVSQADIEAATVAGAYNWIGDRG